MNDYEIGAILIILGIIFLCPILHLMGVPWS